MASGTYSLIAVYAKGSIALFHVTLIAVLVAFIFRVFAVRDHFRQIVPLAAPGIGPDVRGQTPFRKKAGGSR